MTDRALSQDTLELYFDTIIKISPTIVYCYPMSKHDLWTPVHTHNLMYV